MVPDVIIPQLPCGAQRKNADGSFRTAPAKTYPYLLDHFLARLAHKRCMAVLGPLGNLDYSSEEFACSPVAPFSVPFDPYLQMLIVYTFKNRPHRSVAVTVVAWI